MSHPQLTLKSPSGFFFVGAWTQPSTPVRLSILFVSGSRYGVHQMR
jgi:hypothetical protein